MTLMDEDLRIRLPLLNSQRDKDSPLLVARFYDSLSLWNWYAIEFDGDDTFYGLIEGSEPECGFFTLSDFLEINAIAGFARIKRDFDFSPCHIDKPPN